MNTTMNKKRIGMAAALVAGAVVAGGASLAHAATTGPVRFFIHDTSQASIDLGEKGPGHGDLFAYHMTRRAAGLRARLLTRNHSVAKSFHFTREGAFA